MKKILSVFIDESGDFGFIKDASKYYLITLVFYNQSIDISSTIEKIKDKPVFHAGPIIRREYPFQNESIEDRKRIFQSIFMFTMGLPIKCKTFTFIKKDFNNDILKLERRMIRELYNFFTENYEIFKDYKIILYYDNGQHHITRVLNNSLAITGLDYDFKKEVHPCSYRLFQVADFISTVRLLELKLNYNELSKSELKFIDSKHLKKNYLKAINKKEIN